MRESLKPIAFALWAIAGVGLAIASKSCGPIDPILPSLCLGLLVGWICYNYLGQGHQGANAEGSLLGWKVSVQGAVVIIGLVTTLLWLALSAGRECVGNLVFETMRDRETSKLAARALRPTDRIVGYVEAESLGDVAKRLVSEDYFNPVLSALRKPLACFWSKNCPPASNAGFYIEISASEQVPAGELSICDDPILGSEALELTDAIESNIVSKVRLSSVTEGRRRTKFVQFVDNASHHLSSSCETDQFKSKEAVNSKKPIRIYGLMNEQDVRFLTGNPTARSAVVKATSLVGVNRDHID